MRPDRPKLNAQHKEGAKDQPKDIENRRQPQAASKQGYSRPASGQGLVRRHDGSHDREGG
jgi:hypothetical protein